MFNLSPQGMPTRVQQVVLDLLGGLGPIDMLRDEPNRFTDKGKRRRGERQARHQVVDPKAAVEGIRRNQSDYINGLSQKRYKPRHSMRVEST